MVHDDDEEVKDDAELGEGEAELEIPEGGLPEEDEKIDLTAVASSSFSDDLADGEEEDPHEAAFNKPLATDDSQLDPYGVGAPSGFGDEEEEEDYLGEDEELSDDSNAF